MMNRRLIALAAPSVLFVLGCSSVVGQDVSVVVTHDGQPITATVRYGMSTSQIQEALGSPARYQRLSSKRNGNEEVVEDLIYASPGGETTRIRFTDNRVTDVTSSVE